MQVLYINTANQKLMNCSNLEVDNTLTMAKQFLFFTLVILTLATAVNEDLLEQSNIKFERELTTSIGQADDRSYSSGVNLLAVERAGLETLEYHMREVYRYSERIRLHYHYEESFVEELKLVYNNRLGFYQWVKKYKLHKSEHLYYKRSVEYHRSLVMVIRGARRMRDMCRPDVYY